MEATTFYAIIWILLIAEIMMLCYLIYIFIRIKKTVANLSEKLQEKISQKRIPQKKIIQKKNTKKKKPLKKKKKR